MLNNELFLYGQQNRGISLVGSTYMVFYNQQREAMLWQIGWSRNLWNQLLATM